MQHLPTDTRSMVRPDTEAVRASVLSPVSCTVPFSPCPCSVFQIPCLIYGRRKKRYFDANFSGKLRTKFGATSYDVRGYFLRCSELLRTTFGATSYDVQSYFVRRLGLLRVKFGATSYEVRTIFVRSSATSYEMRLPWLHLTYNHISMQ